MRMRRQRAAWADERGGRFDDSDGDKDLRNRVFIVFVTLAAQSVLLVETSPSIGQQQGKDKKDKKTKRARRTISDRGWMVPLDPRASKGYRRLPPSLFSSGGKVHSPRSWEDMNTERSHPSKLRIWERPPTVVHEMAGVLEPSGLPLHGPHYPADFAARLFSSEACIRRHTPFADSKRPSRIRCNGSRMLKHCATLAKAAGFPGFSNSPSIRATPCFAWATAPARIGCNMPFTAPLSSRAVPRIPSWRSCGGNFELRDLPGKFLHASPVSLPLESASIDVAYVGACWRPRRIRKR